MTAPERIWAASVTENYGEWQTTTDGLPRPTEYVRADLVMARCSSCDGTGDVHRADGEWLGECDCGSEFRHAYDVEASPSKAFRAIQGQATRIAALEAKLAERVKVKPLEWEDIHQRRSDEDPTTEWNGGYEADSALGYYEISMGFGSDAYYWAVSDPLSKDIGSDFEDPSDAKAAAQADFEKRIRSAIITHPADRDGVGARTLDEWHEDDGDVCWWALDENGQWLGEPAYIGSPLDLGRAYSLSIGEHEFVATLGGWPGYHTHWTPHPAIPAPPASALKGGE